MALIEQDLRCDVLRRSANCIGALSNNLGKAVINELEIAIAANHDVLGLQVAIDNILAMQVLEDRRDLGAIEAIENETKNYQTRY